MVGRGVVVVVAFCAGVVVGCVVSWLVWLRLLAVVMVVLSAGIGG